MQHKNITTWLSFYSNLYWHLDTVDYIPGIAMIFRALPVELQAHFFEIADGQLPNPDIVPHP